MFKEKYKNIYTNISPSDDLIRQTLQVCSPKSAYKMKSRRRRIGLSMATLVIVFATSVNLIPAFATHVENMPIVGLLARVFAIKSYTESADAYDIKVDQPAVSNRPDINEEIDKAVESYMLKAEKSIADYKDAYLSTGGSEEGFAEKNIEVHVDYEIKSDNAHYLSFVLEMYESWLSSSAVYRYYNIDAKTGEAVTLRALLGEDYITVVNQSISSHIEKSENEGMYFAEDSGGFSTISDQTAFYINESGHPVVVFNKYEIAAGAFGRPEFEIKGEDAISNPTTEYTIEETVYQTEDGGIRIVYPEIRNFKGRLLEDYMNQGIRALLDQYTEDGRYEKLSLSYTVERMDDAYLSILFTGTGVVPDLSEEINVMNAITLDLATSNTITFDNFIVDQVGLNKIIEGKLERSLAYEGMRLYFREDDVVFYYMPLDDSARIFQTISLSFEDLSSVVSYDFGEKPAS